MMDINSATSSFVFDKNFGLEGAALSITLMFIGCMIMYIYCKKNNKFVFRMSNYSDGKYLNMQVWRSIFDGQSSIFFSTSYDFDCIFEVGMTASEFTDTGEFAKYDAQAGGWEEID